MSTTTINDLEAPFGPTTLACPQWCDGLMHIDGESTHTATLSHVMENDGHVDLIADGLKVSARLWWKGECWDEEWPADPAELRDVARIFSEAADKLEHGLHGMSAAAPVDVAMGWVVRSALREGGVSHGRAAQALGMSTKRLRRSLNGRRSFYPATELAVIAELAGVGWVELFERAERARS